MKHFEYICISLWSIPDSIIQHYNLESKIHNGVVYVEVRNRMYGLPQSGCIANGKLMTHLEHKGFRQAQVTHDLLLHTDHPMACSLVVDNFGVKYVRHEHAEYFKDTLKEHYDITIE